MTTTPTRTATAEPQPQRQLTERVAEEIRAMMARRRITGARLARELGVSPAWISYRLTGAQPIDLNDLQAIAAALGVAVGALLPRDVLSGEGVTTLYPQVTERATRGTREHRGHRPNGYPDASVAPGNRRTSRIPRTEHSKRP